MVQDIKPVYAKKDFESDQEIRWCPGCGDYSILAQVQRTLPEFQTQKEKYVFVSGIGCSSRFPYYMNTYGFHSIHGRAPAIATGIKAANPELTVFVISGDGDSLSIGGNHFLHVLRRNLDINYLLFNNRIYGLTKGQYSPTSETGKITKSTPMGSLEHPLNPLSVALGAGATFVARAMDRDPKGLQDVIRAAIKHRGTSFVEVYQNCNIFNDGAFEHLTEKDTKPDNTIWLEHGKPLVFGAKKNKGIRLDGFKPVVVNLEDGSSSVNDLLVHDMHNTDPVMAFIYSQMTEAPGLPTPIGVFRSIQKSCYEEDMRTQIALAKDKMGPGDLKKLLHKGDTWTVE
ncbi:2-oxoacid:ferredoxin oxidoreductase subunit beta [bacterium]|nr:2-oxoacid:ferredoxin oxidoreductase subunit beta [bacterium]NUN47110.1 2-oxoacid:ferredoxin oxidoreductase subunit beta [bacterium]HMW33046.1 2-oxoacid:ferredoxin oxidoreductase subunit beta [bacterium]HMW36918.1 2-oxoacid:ferredoxin oxidoreductase subunit beta [bacterium]HMY35564.1 2-oxoacid:ferredoxin oxidoreductase subunit beta [bacterium]